MRQTIVQNLKPEDVFIGLSPMVTIKGLRTDEEGVLNPSSVEMKNQGQKSAT